VDSACEVLHFGGGLSGAPDDGLFKFKAGFSPDRAMFKFGTFLGDKESYVRICDAWQTANPDKVSHYGNRFLKYRY
jgi:hypothetical protein